MESATRSRLVRAYVWVIILAAAAGLSWSAHIRVAPPAGSHGALTGIVAFTVLGLLLQLAEHRLTVGSAAGAIAFIVSLCAALVFGRR